MALVRCILRKSLRVACHCFPHIYKRQIYVFLPCILIQLHNVNQQNANFLNQYFNSILINFIAFYSCIYKAPKSIDGYKTNSLTTTSNTIFNIYRQETVASGKSKAVSLQTWSGPEGSRKLRFPDFMTTAQDGGVSLTHRPHLPPGNTSGTHF